MVCDVECVCMENKSHTAREKYKYIVFHIEICRFAFIGSLDCHLL